MAEEKTLSNNDISNRIRDIRNTSSNMLGKSFEHRIIQNTCDELVKYFDNLK